MTATRQIQSSDVQFAPAALTISRALVSDDNGATLVYTGSSNITLTINTGLSSGFGCTVVQLGAGIVSMAAGAGVTLDNAGATIGVNTFLNVVNVSFETYVFQNPTTNQTRTLIQSGIPFILVSSGSIGNNGALTGITALPTTYSGGAYLYFPADAIAVGVAAGWYYTVMSSTTAGTIFNNIYTSGQPTIPASPTAFATTGPGAFVQTIATDIAGPAYTLPAGTLGTNGEVIMDGQHTYTNSGNTKTMRAQFDGNNLLTATATTTANFRMNVSMRNRGRTDKQISGVNAFNTASSTGTTYTSADTSVNKALRFVMQLANAADNLTLESFSMKLSAVS